MHSIVNRGKLSTAPICNNLDPSISSGDLNTRMQTVTQLIHKTRTAKEEETSVTHAVCDTSLKTTAVNYMITNSIHM